MYHRSTKYEIDTNQDFTCQILDWKTNKDIVNPNNKFDNSDTNEDNDLYEIHLFGITELNKSVHITVTDFKPYFYVEIEKYWNTTHVRMFINKVKEVLKSNGKGQFIKNLIANKIVKKHKFYGFTNNEEFKFLCLIFNTIEAFNAFKYLLSNYRTGKIRITGMSYARKFKLYESNIDPLLRFIHMRDLESCGWLKIPANKYKINPHPNSYAQIDITCKWRNVFHYESAKMTSIIQASFDIECTSEDGSFPQAERENDKIIQIGTTVREYGSDGFLLKHIITLDTCSPIEGCVVESYETEEEVLLAWTKLIQRLDPDILYGYNIYGFDYKYMYGRAEFLGIEDEFSILSKIKDLPCELKTKRLSSSALGDNTMYLPELPGRISVDIMKVVQRDHNLVSYKLNSVAEHFIKDKKDDVSPQQIFAFQKGSADDRRIIAKYCIQDCALLNDLADKLNILINNIGMANVCSVPLNYIFMRGQGIKIFSLVAKFCRKENALIPVITYNELYSQFKYKNPKYKHHYKDEEGAKKAKEAFNINAKFDGAIVLDPIVGFHKYVVVKDYASLYPSEMIASNLSHDTFINDPKYDNLSNIEYKVVSYKNGDGTMNYSKFAKVPGKRGIIPKILMQLLAERKKFKKKMALEKDPFQKAVLDGVQLALKVTCNSVYGQCGAATSPIYLKDVAASTTAGGRNKLLFAKNYVESNHPTAKCVYGDTDSIFVDYGIDETGKTEKEVLQESINLGIEYGKRISEAINEYPHDLEYEKTFCPLLLMSKKRYVGNLYEFDVNKFKRKSMGDASKRRDYAPIVKTIYNRMVEILLNEKDESKAVKYVLRLVEEMMNGQIDHNEFIISKSLRNGYKDRKRITHVVLADRIAKRDPGNAPQSNDRIPYMYIECFKKDKIVGDNIEDPNYILENNIKIDYLYYLERQIMNPICQILGLLVETPENLFYEAIQQEKNIRKNHQRKITNISKGQKEISTFFTIPIKPVDSTIHITIPDNVILKDKIIDDLKEKQTTNLDKWFK